jgi:hypothetical protein
MHSSIQDKILGINLVRRVKHVYNKNYKTLVEKLKRTRKMERHPTNGLR